MFKAEFRDLGDDCRVFSVSSPHDGRQIVFSAGRFRREIDLFVTAPEELLPIADAIYAACNIPKPEAHGDGKLRATIEGVLVRMDGMDDQYIRSFVQEKLTAALDATKPNPAQLTLAADAESAK